MNRDPAGPAGPAELALAGTVKGTYTLQGGEARFAQDTSSGSAILTAARRSHKLPASRAADIFSPIGVATVTCTSTAMLLTARTASYELVRV